MKKMDDGRIHRVEMAMVRGRGTEVIKELVKQRDLRFRESKMGAGNRCEGKVIVDWGR